MQKKTLLALAFAGALLNTQIPAESINESTPADSLIQQIADNAELTPEIRAYHLLSLAGRYLNGDDKTKVAAQYDSVAKGTTTLWLAKPSRRQDAYIPFADRVSGGRYMEYTGSRNDKSDPKSISAENLKLANTALQTAMVELNQTTEKFAKLDMYYIASRLFLKAGNRPQARRYKKIVDKAIRSCEIGSDNDEDEIKAAASILNSMAHGTIPIYISDRITPAQPPTTSVSEEDFLESEKLKLRALVVIDRLPSTNHERRKAHRDMVLWYLQLNKDELADREKLVLFELVGIHDNSILYPQTVGCGRLVWWKKKEDSGYAYACGIG